MHPPPFARGVDIAVFVDGSDDRIRSLHSRCLFESTNPLVVYVAAAAHITRLSDSPSFSSNGQTVGIVERMHI